MTTSLGKHSQMSFSDLALKTKDVDISGSLSLADGTAITVTGAELNRLDDSLSTNYLSPSSGITTDAEDYASGIERSGELIITRIYFDLTGLVGSTTDLDIIGKSAVASNFGQITTAKSGLIRGGTMQCLEVPAGGADDIDLYSATVGTGAENVDVTTLTETALVTSGGAWTAGLVKPLTGYPTANDYLYVCNGEAAVPGTFTAGKFVITLFGMTA